MTQLGIGIFVSLMVASLTVGETAAVAGPICVADQDGDGLCDLWETSCLVSFGQRTSLLSADSDGDHIRDDVEVGAYGVPADGVARDTDGDGIIDGCDEDSDGDGLSDLEESGCDFICDDPVDTDGDGIPDYRDTDSDNDGVPDGEDPAPRDPSIPGHAGSGSGSGSGGGGSGTGSDTTTGSGGGGSGVGGGSGGGAVGSNVSVGSDMSTDGTDGAGSDPGPGSAPGGDPFAGLTVTGGGCSTSGSGGGAGSGLALLVGMVAVRRRRRRVGAAAGVACAVVVAGVGSARADGISADLMRPGVLGEGGVAVASSDTLGAYALQVSALGDFASHPIEFRDATGNRAMGVIDSLTTLDVRVGLGLPHGFEVSVFAPFALDRTSDMDGISAHGVGDLGLAAKWSARRGRYGVAVAPELVVPTGDAAQFGGDGSVGVLAQLIGDAQVGDVRLGVITGVRARADQASWNGASAGQQILWGGVADWRVAAAPRLHLLGEVHGAVAATGAGSPAEALGEARYDFGGVTMIAGAGAGLSASVGVPTWRAFFGGAIAIGGGRSLRRVAAAPPPQPASVEAQPQPAPVEAHDPSPSPSPSPSPVPMPVPAAPAVVEVPAAPVAAPVYSFADDKPIVFHDIRFDTGKWRILPVSYGVLDDIAQSLATQPTVRVRVEGHTDSRGGDTANLALSQQRALAIVNYLVAAGVEPGRLEYEGFGSSRPVASNATAGGQQDNRRVELRVISRTLHPSADR